MAPSYGLRLSAAYLAIVSTVAPALADNILSSSAAACTRQITAKTGDSCVSVSQANSITVTQFLQFNPAVTSCALSAGQAYCVSTDPALGSPLPPPAVSSPSTPSSSTPTPIQPAAPSGSSVSSGSSGLIPSPDGSDGICGGQYTCLGSVYGACCSANGYCGNTADYCGEGCNPAYGQCGVCPAVEPGAATATVTAFFTTTSILVSTVTAGPTVTVTHTITATLPPVPTTSKPPGVSTPSPTLPGTTRNCQRWYLVRATDNCRRIALTYGTTQNQIVAWNPNFDCDDIEDMAGNYICVGVQSAIGATIGIGNPFGGL
ncbi:uncharacterized protein SPSK_07742 [Sporothrix schenckii 1099-18]|uniref:Chitin-binding type-1 domain-containing protein n=2 Tax=Sporothrix schenckii TaxID=29908 RepID=U7PYA1_SPOS1|nr:uncharacterized protein SPSK_07742 [Sporothrix schenckii 1099-18]ERT00634.1 hypothetical protein HMPREF1624_01861 [Sporothrix schenckii ATCC 58251]KJR87697.1 hypothetical protein SPSK_07742 [Sporothrix schenckii 1099-18]